MRSTSKCKRLKKEQKAYNRRIGSERIGIEHVNRRLKRFRIFSGRYRNRRRRFGLRISLFCGLYYFDLAIS